MSSSRLLLVLPLRIYDVSGRLFIDTQACNGLRLWLDNFEFVTCAGPSEMVMRAPPATSPIETMVESNRIKILMLPLAYRPVQFAAALPRTIPLLKAHIVNSDYLHFAIGGLWGDWAAVSCLIAKTLKRSYAVWTDRVESRVAEFHARSTHGFRRIHKQAVARIMMSYERHLIRHASLGLFHGMDCYEAYARFCCDPHVVHDIHLGPKDRISNREFDLRLERPRRPLRLIYAGRVHLEKGVFDWIEALSIVARANIDFSAIWYGEGPELQAARDRIGQLGLSEMVSFPGALERSQLMHAMRESDAFVFCHKTLESPRCLIEALICGLPIIGYRSGYSQDLCQDGAGLLTPINNSAYIAESIAEIEDRDLLRVLSKRAFEAGRNFTDEEVFRHRSILMKTTPARPLTNPY